jgi:2'-5' RNA ligase
MEQTALIVPVPEAEPAVGRVRAALDRSAGWGVPAHVTVLFPFLPPERVTDEVVAAVGEVVASVPRFEVTFARVDWFGTDAVWLAPEPDDGFRALTGAVWRRFPETPPYGGIHDDVIPHLTIGHGHPLRVLRAAAEEVSGRLPVTATVDRVLLIAGSTGPGSWRTLHELALGRATATPGPDGCGGAGCGGCGGGCGG